MPSALAVRAILSIETPHTVTVQHTWNDGHGPAPRSSALARSVQSYPVLPSSPPSTQSGRGRRCGTVALSEPQPSQARCALTGLWLLSLPPPRPPPK
jgi:hypothetical protein